MPNLLLCMTPGVGLSTWAKAGILERELKPYLRYAELGWKIKILTYDKGDIPPLPPEIEPVRLKSKRALPLIAITHRRLSAWADIIKTNQSKHAYFYVHAARRWGLPVLLRAGYVEGRSMERRAAPAPAFKRLIYPSLEGWAFRRADRATVPTSELSDWVLKRYRPAPENLRIVPNFVDLEMFRPMPEIRERAEVDRKTRGLSVVSVGRLSEVKGYDLLLRAATGLRPVPEVTIYGEGPERESLGELARRLGVTLNLPGVVTNSELPELLNRHDIFVLPSLYEGHPKALIEGMSCGLAALAVRNPGTGGVIEEGVSGLLVEHDAGALSEGLRRLASADFRRKLGNAGRGAVAARFGFDAVFEKEYSIVRELLG